MTPEALAEQGTPRSGRDVDAAGRLLLLLSRFGLPVVLVILVLAFSLARPETFGTWVNLRAVLDAQVTIAFLAFAATLPLIVGHFDLSIAAVAALSQVVVVGLVLQRGWPVPAAIAVVCASAITVGLVNGVAVGRFGMNSFVGTLATGSIVTGAILGYTDGASIYGSAPEALTSIARSSIGGLPLPVVYMAAVALVLTLFLGRYPAGRRMYAVGINRRAAERTGIATQRYVIATFVASALLAAVAGVLQGARLGAATPDAGLHTVIPAFAGAFLGATAFWPGRFNIAGTATAVYVIGVAVTGLQQIGVALWVEPVFQGAMLFLAVGLSFWSVRLRAARARTARLRELDLQASVAPAGTGDGRHQRDDDDRDEPWPDAPSSAPINA